jgi:phosphohistidine phosphatase
MKTLFLIRHAKSSWANTLQQDFDRPLNDRGNRDAPMMAQRLLKDRHAVDAFISSPAKRAIATCKYFVSAFGRKEKEIIQKPELYHAPVKVFYQVIEETDDNFNSIAVFAHNPGITEFANELSNVHIDNMPTCSIYAVKIEIAAWKEFAGSKKNFMLFDYPKKV